MKIGPALMVFVLLSLFYICALAYIDRANHVFEHGTDLAKVLPVASSFALASFLLRYLRWHWLLARRHFRVPWFMGLLAYLSGFALTASPGKVGELLRIRYFGAMKVPADQVIACFVFEQVLDLIVVLLLSAGLGTFVPGTGLAFAFVALVIIAVIVVSRFSSMWMTLAQRLQKAGWHRLASLSSTLASALVAAVQFFGPREFSVAMLLGVAAWTIQSLGCVYVVQSLGITVPPLAAFSLYPLALLIGAASMLPGGIGTTEVAIVFVLHAFGTSFERGALATIGMRLSTLWFAIALGLIAVPILEFAARRPSWRSARCET